jgi:peptidoglycan/LPS O-acetylase OafA/YrhL
MSRFRRPSRVFVIAAAIAALLIYVIVYFGLNPDPTAAVVATVVFVVVGIVLFVFAPVHHALLIWHIIEWLDNRRRRGEDPKPRDSSSR